MAHYVDNKQLFEVMKKYKREVNKSKREGTHKPDIPEYVGRCLLLIANNLSHKPSFINYAFREEMIGDGVENCIAYIDNFNPRLSKNPFAYFTQIIYYAFLRRIQKEKKHLYVKHKSIEKAIIDNTIADFVEGDDSIMIPTIDINTDTMKDFINTFENSMKQKKLKRKKNKC